MANAITPLELRHTPERIQQIVDSAIWPRPVIEIYAIENPEDPAVGVLVVTVPASALAPHYTRERFPARSGTTTRYLAEREIAALYEQRRESFMASVDRPMLSDHLDPADLPQRKNGIGELRLFVAPFADVRHSRGVHLGRPLAEAGRAARETVAWLSHSHRQLLDLFAQPWEPRGTLGWQLGTLGVDVRHPIASATCTYQLSLSFVATRSLDVGDAVAWSAHEDGWTADTLAFLSFAGHFFGPVPGASLLRVEIGLDGLQGSIASAAHGAMLPGLTPPQVVDNQYRERTQADARELATDVEAAARRLLDRMWISFVPEQTDAFIRLKSTV